MARPLKLTEEITARLCQDIAAGLPYKTACARAGLGYRTFMRYQARAIKAKRGRLWQFWQRIEGAEQQAQARLMSLWQAQAPQDWRAAKAYLAARWPEQYGHLERGPGKPPPKPPPPGEGGTVIQILSAIPRAERPTHPLPTLAEREAAAAAEIAEAPAATPVPAAPSRSTFEAASEPDLGI